jgi:predicted carbohydrate-binding protein with CBM48
VNNRFRESSTFNDRASDARSLLAAGSKPHPTWAGKEGLPLPLGASWVADEKAFNFAVYAEHAESVTLLFYSAQDLVEPILKFQFDVCINAPVKAPFSCPNSSLSRG